MADPTYYTQDFSDMRLPDDPNPKEVDKCIPRFHLIDGMKGDELIRVEMVEIITPGDRLSRPVQRVTEEHKARWPRQYAAFKSGIDLGINGTAIAMWGEISWQMQADLRAAGFQTVEDLAGAHDGQINNIPNGTIWRKKAQVFLANKRTVSDKDKEIDELKARLAKLEASHVLPAQGTSDDSGGGNGNRRKVSKSPTGLRRGRPPKSSLMAGVPAPAPDSTAS